MQAGPWSITSQIMINGQYYTRDGQEHPESFFALSGLVLSTLKIDNLQASQTDTVYEMSFQSEHDIPPNGFIYLKVPIESYIPKTVEVISKENLISANSTSILLQTKSGVRSETGFNVTVKGVMNVRSLKPSSAFFIATMDDQQYIIDSGGQDIIV